ncbi:MAG TPA: hypothetical protein DEG17_20000 [Cyanobacteria bacterium UBA11149]|nr:hypothetical protein [Cyanobacteria bacterium UBA11366]HBK66014.1 hypothetical protein [Cyanobacteria bacterium UBA11166]HBR76925.1 hypothetical protein [Cyanobacteria bacterium UBA11159]HBS68314.1 hypothetical protein [Cyanobacteria bacterium UBA11153]HBW91081.1 hypothetical protein [Cyanobacteria bacterium UBA11149]HCA94734.1 hypothetical protein [Cyanobacteria bacterium UBA9226]
MAQLLQDRIADEKAISKLIAKTWLDEEFKTKFIANTNEALEENGVVVPSGVQFIFRDNTLVGIRETIADSSNDEVVYEITLPNKPTEITDRPICSWSPLSNSISGFSDFNDINRFCL